MYSIHGHGLIVADRRSDLYAEALRRTIRPGHTVVDVGTGVGLWALVACALGASRVIAIEPDPLIAFAIEAAAANGMADRISFINQPVRDVTRDIDAVADVVVADLRDVLPFAPASVTGMIEARRFLKPGATMIPRRDSVWVAVVESESAYTARTSPWETTRFGVDLSAIRRAAISVPRKERFSRDALLTSPVRWAEMDYLTMSGPDVSNEVALVADRAGVAHGFAMWFDTDLTEDVRFSNAPGAPPLLYGQAFFPWPSPVAVERGDCIHTSVRAIHDGTDYTINIQAVVRSADGQTIRARFDQSTFDAVPLIARAMVESKPSDV